MALTVDWHGVILSGGWRLVSSVAKPDVSEVADARHERWSARRTHEHPAMELLVPLSGEGRYGWMERTYPARPGTVFFFDSMEPHDMGYPEWCGRMEHLWVAVAENHVFARTLAISRGVVKDVTASRLMFNLEDEGLDIGRIARDCRALKAEQPDLARRMLMTALDGMLCRLVEYDRRGRGAAGEFTAASVIETIRLHVRTTGGRGATITHLARMAGYSRFHFLRLFREHTGRTVHEYVDECRLDRTVELLKQGAKLNRISEELGVFVPGGVFEMVERPQEHDGLGGGLHGREASEAARVRRSTAARRPTSPSRPRSPAAPSPGACGAA